MPFVNCGCGKTYNDATQSSQCPTHALKAKPAPVAAKTAPVVPPKIVPPVAAVTTPPAANGQLKAIGP